MKRFVITEEEKKHIMGLYEQTQINDYTNAFNSIIKPWMEDMNKKWFSQGFSCESVTKTEPGMSKCDNSFFGFKKSPETQNQYYFPFEMGINLYMFAGDSGSYFRVFEGKTRKTIGEYGKEAKSKQDVNKAANDAINAFNQYASRAWSYAYPK